MWAVQFYVQRNGGLTVTLSIYKNMQCLLGAPCCTPVCCKLSSVSRDTREHEITREYRVSRLLSTVQQCGPSGVWGVWGGVTGVC